MGVHVDDDRAVAISDCSRTRPVGADKIPLDRIVSRKGFEDLDTGIDMARDHVPRGWRGAADAIARGLYEHSPVRVERGRAVRIEPDKVALDDVSALGAGRHA